MNDSESQPNSNTDQLLHRLIAGELGIDVDSIERVSFSGKTVGSTGRIVLTTVIEPKSLD